MPALSVDLARPRVIQLRLAIKTTTCTLARRTFLWRPSLPRWRLPARLGCRDRAVDARPEAPLLRLHRACEEHAVEWQRPLHGAAPDRISGPHCRRPPRLLTSCWWTPNATTPSKPSTSRGRGNPQQGTMFYWNPKAADTQLIFNDRDLKTNTSSRSSTTSRTETHSEYRYEDTPSATAAWRRWRTFLGLNYGRMARLRSVTGYPEAFDCSKGVAAPDNDGIFLVEIETGKKRLLVFLPAVGGTDCAGASGCGRQAPVHQFTRCGIATITGSTSMVRPISMPRRGGSTSPARFTRDGSGLTMHPYVGGHPGMGIAARTWWATPKAGRCSTTWTRRRSFGPLGPKRSCPRRNRGLGALVRRQVVRERYRAGHEDFYARAGGAATTRLCARRGRAGG